MSGWASLIWMGGELANGNSPVCVKMSVVMLFVGNEAFYKKTAGSCRNIMAL